MKAFTAVNLNLFLKLFIVVQLYIEETLNKGGLSRIPTPATEEYLESITSELEGIADGERFLGTDLE